MAMTAAPATMGSTMQGPHGGAFRPPAVGVRGVVSSAHNLASQAGIRALQQGGNAVDAAVAVAATLAVVEPFMSGLGGGGGYMLIREGTTGQIHGLDYLGRAPRAAQGNAWTDQEEVYSDVRATCQPSAVAGWLAALERFGRLDRAAVFSFAIEVAERGWPITAFAAGMLANAEARLSRFASSRAAYFPDGRVPRVGELVPQPGMARSLRMIAEGGADVYYKGQLGEEITRAIQEAGGWLTMDDLGDIQLRWLEPLAIQYRGNTVMTMPPECSGIQYLESMRILEAFDLEGLGHNTTAYLHLLLETVKLASADRAAYTMDPSVPATSLLADDFVAGRRALIDFQQAAQSEGERYLAKKDGLVAPGDPLRYKRDHTTHFEAVDDEGNLVSVTQSNGGVFGNAFVAGATGIPMNNFLYWQDVNPDSPNYLRPGRPMECPMAPCIVTRDGAAVLGIGTPGSYGILQTTLQMLLNHLDFGFNVQAAIEAPRFRAFERTLVDVEGRLPTETVDGLRALGHELRILAPFTNAVGGGHGVAVDPRSGLLTGGADPRRDGASLGW
ncbi:MAG: gamma-glutamyltransferase [Chloroflexi bacterium]|nr:gamma-glutamyltransferase [Chloroflexota bacterium]